MPKSNIGSPKVMTGVVRLPVAAATAFAARSKGIAADQGEHSLSRIARFRDTCKACRS